jgi:cation diffusion facilitator family transporter
MHRHESTQWEHEHAFGMDAHADGERRTRWVVALTLAMMIAEIAAGSVFHSMALLADGWHMGTHAAALGVAVFAYAYARRHARDPAYSFGTGKVGALAGFASAVGLAAVALMVFGESVARLRTPLAIRFDEAIGVAIVGLAVNVVCALLLRDHSAHDHDHAHSAHAHAHHDHNLRGAYLHVLADALTSLLAIFALATGKVLGWTWMDPAMGIVGAVVIVRWSLGLLGETSRVLLDAEVAGERRDAIRAALEAETDDRVADLHLWRVGPRHLAAVVSVVTHEPRPAEYYKQRLAAFRDLAHVTVEVQRCAGPPCDGATTSAA